MPAAGPCRRDIAANQGEGRDDEIEPPDEGPANRERELIGLLGTQLIRRHPIVRVKIKATQVSTRRLRAALIGLALALAYAPIVGFVVRSILCLLSLT